MNNGRKVAEGGVLLADMFYYCSLPSNSLFRDGYIFLFAHSFYIGND